jgi:two-component system C4-dicarboxylate transport response regulator DctD
MDLLGHHGFSVQYASSAAKAIEKLNADNFNAVILGLSMSDGDGIPMLRLLKETAPATPIIMLARVDQRASALRNGAFAFFLKPWDRRKLLDALARAISKT